MELTEDQIYEKNAKHFVHCKKKILLPYDFEWTCVWCGNNVKETKAWNL